MPPLFIFPHPLASVKKTVLRPTNPGCLFPILAPATSGPPAQRQRQNEGGLAISSDTPDPARFGLVSTAAPTRRDTIDRGSRQAAKHAKQKRKENPAYLSLFFALFLGIVGVSGHAQQPSAPSRFDVASVKPNLTGGEARRAGASPGGMFTASNVSLRLLISRLWGCGSPD